MIDPAKLACLFSSYFANSKNANRFCYGIDASCLVFELDLDTKQNPN